MAGVLPGFEPASEQCSRDFLDPPFHPVNHFDPARAEEFDGHGLVPPSITCVTVPGGGARAASMEELECVKEGIGHRDIGIVQRTLATIVP